MNILLVDDDRHSRNSVGEFLRDCGHAVTECADGQSALDNFAGGDFHLVLSDIRMPGMSGLELLKRIRALPGKKTEIILFTGYGDVESAVEALRAGAYDYLLKPINVEELVRVTDRLAEHQSLRRENEILTTRFNDAVKAETEETRQELHRIRKAFVKSMGLDNLILHSEAMQDVIRQAVTLHGDRAMPVLIDGETGTGKEIVARYIHYSEDSIAEPFVDVNCAALAPAIFDSELFGYEAGAFTGGLPGGKLGKFDLARGGTIFLDEIGEIPVELQAKLLRVIQEREFYRVGGLKKIKCDVRLICATNVDLEEQVAQGKFRRDLYYRLNVGRVHLPPLRQRTEDILPLAEMFLTSFSREKRKHFAAISQDAAKILLSYNWPGNVRELKNALERVVLMWDDRELKPAHLVFLSRNPDPAPGGIAGGEDVSAVINYKSFLLPPGKLPIDEYVNNIIIQALGRHSGNKTETAKYLGITRRSLYSRLKHLGLDVDAN